MLSCTTKIADRWRRAYSFVRYQEIDVSAVEHQSFQIVHAALIKLQDPKAFPGFANDGAYAPTTLSAQLDFVVLVIDIIGKGEQITGAVTFWCPCRSQHRMWPAQRAKFLLQEPRWPIMVTAPIPRAVPRLHCLKSLKKAF